MPRPGDGWLEQLCGIGPPVIIAIDYADSRADLVAVLQRVAALAAPSAPRRRVRVLLLARSDGGLVAGATAIAALCDAMAIELRLLANTPPSAPRCSQTPSARSRRTAGGRPWSARSCRSTTSGSSALCTSTWRRSPPSRDCGALGAGALMTEVLDHEERFWTREVSDRTGAAIDIPLAHRLVVAAPPARRLASVEDAQALCKQIGRQPRARADDARIALLHDVYNPGIAACTCPASRPTCSART